MTQKTTISISNSVKIDSICIILRHQKLIGKKLAQEKLAIMFKKNHYQKNTI
jgi:hypothetical protein